tara:strand:- start:3326 stop:3529 length:204 start_codon:yes stop_codon:yes gene_type:complete
MNYLSEIFYPHVELIELTDVELLRAYEQLKKNPPEEMNEVLRVSNELINRGWRKTEEEEWEWRVPGL